MHLAENLAEASMAHLDLGGRDSEVQYQQNSDPNRYMEMNNISSFLSTHKSRPDDAFAVFKFPDLALTAE